MAVYDRWHLSHPPEGAKPCEHRRNKTPLYPTGDHGQGRQWQVRWRDPDGKPKKRSFDKKPAAEDFDATTRNELSRGTYVDPAAGKVTLEAFAKQWRKDLTGDPNTLANIDHRLAHIIDVETAEGATVRRAEGTSVIGKRSMQELARKPSSIQSWVKSLEGRGLSPGYIKHIVTTLSSIFTAAMDDGIVHRNPVRAKSVNPPAVSRQRVVPWTPQQIQAAGAELGGRDEAMVYCGSGLGLRQGEIFGLAEEDIDFLGRVVHVLRQVRIVDGQPVFKPPKYDKERDVPLSPAMSLMLAAQIKEYPPVKVTLPWKVPTGRPTTARLLFVRPDGKVHHRQNFSYVWPRARKAAGMPATRENGMHVLRHTFASATLADGVDIRTLADWLGHADPGFTLRTYTHMMPSAADRGRAAIDKFFAEIIGENPEQNALKVPSER